MKLTQSMRVLAIAVAAATCLATSAFGAAYIKFDGVDGESTDEQYKGWIEVQGISHDISTGQQSSSAPRGGGGAGKASFSDITFTKQLDKSSPKLMEACCTGKHFTSVKLELARQQNGAPTPTPYYTITLSDCIISSYSMSSGGDRPSESLSLNFTKIEFKYTYQDASGESQSVQFGWDLKANKKV